MGKRHSVYFDGDVHKRLTELKTLSEGKSFNKVVNELCRLGYKEYSKYITTSVEALMEDINHQIGDIQKYLRSLNQVKDAILMCGAFSEDYRKELEEGLDPMKIMNDYGRRKRKRVGLKELREQGRLSPIEDEAIQYLLEKREALAQHLAWLVVQHKKLEAKRRDKLVTVQVPLQEVK